MIIRQAEGWRLFITQPDHAVLAAAIMRAWRGDGFDEHPRRDVILRAVREHDNGWIEEDATTLVDERGTPLDFVSVPDAVKHRIWPRAVARVARRSAYEAALVAQHALTVHAQHRGNAAWQPFFDGLERTRDTLLGGAADATNVGLAWAYVATRVAHSFVQATRNVIPVRFMVFSLGSILLMILLVRTALHLA